MPKKNVTFSFFHTAISRNSVDLDKTQFGVCHFLNKSYKCAKFTKRIGRGPWKYGHKSVDLTWNQYSLFGHPLSKVASHSYLGVKLDSKLSWAKHITEITSKSSKVLGMVKRTLGPCKPEVKDTAYNMLVRPKLEYASPIWNPHKSSQISRLERIQHYAARFVANDHRRTNSPTTQVLTLNWQTLERRIIIKQAMTFYKILNNIIKISPPSGFLTRSHNRHHDIVPRSRLDTVVYSFYLRAIRIWNTIPKAITEISKPESFQAAISKLPFTTPIHLKCL